MKGIYSPYLEFDLIRHALGKIIGIQSTLFAIVFRKTE
jgi:hypothetical protein